MKPHKWAKEIKAWADGAIIESKSIIEIDDWDADTNPYWECNDLEFRIKSQPKESQYLYAWLNKGDENIQWSYDTPRDPLEDDLYKYLGKIKLEVNDE